MHSALSAMCLSFRCCLATIVFVQDRYGTQRLMSFLRGLVEQVSWQARDSAVSAILLPQPVVFLVTGMFRVASGCQRVVPQPHRVKLLVVRAEGALELQQLPPAVAARLSYVAAAACGRRQLPPAAWAASGCPWTESRCVRVRLCCAATPFLCAFAMPQSFLYEILLVRPPNHY
jgi:hypothetical protein